MISAKDCTFSDDTGLSEIFNEHFVNITKTLDLKPSFCSTAIRFPKIIEASKDYCSIERMFSFQRDEFQFKFHSLSENHFRKKNLTSMKKGEPKQ